MRSGPKTRVASGLAIVGLAFAVYALSVLGAFGVVGASAESGSVFSGAYAYQYQYGCPVLAHWHYSPAGSSGSWSATKSADCQTGFVSIGPQAMDGDLRLRPGTTLKTGYAFKLPSQVIGRTAIVTDAKVVFQLRCEGGATPSPATLTVTMPTQFYAAADTTWSPSSSESSPLTYQGSSAVPNACGGARVRFDRGGTFSATIQLF